MSSMEQNAKSKWQGRVSKRLTNAKSEQIWPLFTDFFNFHKYFPSLATCYGVHGTNGDPGCIRYCAGFSIPSKNATVSWSKERLVAIDHKTHCMWYEMVDGNIGFKSYVSMVRIVEDGENEGCVIEWEFSVEPVGGLMLDDLVNKYEIGLERMAKIMEDAILQISD